MWEAFEIGVLGPQGGLVGEGDGVDQGISEREFVFDEEICCGDGDGLVDGNDNAGAHGLGDFVGLFQAALLQGNLADFGNDNAGNEEIGQFAEDRTEMERVRTLVEAFEPSARVKDGGFHGEALVGIGDPARGRT